MPYAESYRFGQRLEVRTHDLDVPGPGSYDAAFSSSPGGPKTQGFSMGSQLSVSRSAEMPGPGEYEVRSSINASAGFTLYGKLDSAKVSDVPVSCSLRHRGRREDRHVGRRRRMLPALLCVHACVSRCDACDSVQRPLAEIRI